MKTLLSLSLIFSVFYANANEMIVPLDMEPGYWEITSAIGESDMIDQMIANMPESQRTQMRTMMESQMKPPVIKQCITKDSHKDMDKELREFIGVKRACKFNVTKTNNKEFMGQLDCPNNTSTIHTKVITAKRHESNVVTKVENMGTNTIQTISEWKSATCPAGL